MAKYTYDEPTNREDLTDVVTRISPEQTIITQLCGKEKVTATKHEWPEDELGDAQDNAHVEGEENTAVPAPPRKRPDNYTQIMKRGYSVTDTQQAVKTAGVSDELGYNMIKAMKELAKDLERQITLSATKNAGTTATPRIFGGIPYFVVSNAVDHGGTAQIVTRDDITSALQKAWEAGGEPTKLIVSGSNKRIISALTTSNTKSIEAAKKQVIEAIDIIDTDFGRIEISASRFMPDGSIYILDPQYLSIGWLRPFKSVDLPKTADAEAKVIVGEMTFIVKAEKSQAIIKDLKVA